MRKIREKGKGKGVLHYIYIISGSQSYMYIYIYIKYEIIDQIIKFAKKENIVLEGAP